jgi:predicted DCC family thiol-disulfide oxidoreductase YuxK
VNQRASSNTPVLLYDGTCGFCADSVQFVLRRDGDGPLKFAALDSSFGRSVLERHPEVRGFDSMLFVEPASADSPERIYAHSTAALHIARYLGGRWRVFSIARVIPPPVRDAVYRFIARHRHRLSRPQCVVPSPDERERFLE